VIVADANLIIYRYLRGPLSEMADAAVRRDDDWRTSPLWRIEFTSAAVKMIRGGVVDEAEATAALALASREMSPRELHAPQAAVVRLALATGVSAYDAQYAAISERFGIRCVSADASFVKKAAPLAVSLSEFIK
jgi:predicted nucleic acid-binding protein